MDEVKPVSLGAQLDEIRYEIRMRSEVYPRQVTRGKMRQGEADEHMRRIKAVLATLQALQEQRAERK